MEKTTIEGVEYYAADQVETLIRSRLAKVSERARTAEAKLEEMEGQLALERDAKEPLISEIENLQQLLKGSPSPV